MGSLTSSLSERLEMVLKDIIAYAETKERISYIDIFNFEAVASKEELKEALRLADIILTNDLTQCETPIKAISKIVNMVKNIDLEKERF